MHWDETLRGFGVCVTRQDMASAMKAVFGDWMHRPIVSISRDMVGNQPT
jgi:hypothetical protein